jgi:magnesium-transporting ATPase (P-type)
MLNKEDSFVTIQIGKFIEKYEQVKEFEFTAERKMMSILYKKVSGFDSDTNLLTEY